MLPREDSPILYRSIPKKSYGGNIEIKCMEKDFMKTANTKASPYSMPISSRVTNLFRENDSQLAELYAALRRRMRTTAAGSHSTSPDQELHIYVGSVARSAAEWCRAAEGGYQRPRGTKRRHLRPEIQLQTTNSTELYLLYRGK